MSHFPYLSVLTLFPLVGALIILLLPKGADQVVKVFALVWSLLSLVITGLAAYSFVPSGPRFQLVESYPWIPAFGVRFAFGVDGIALVMLALVALLTPIVVLASWHDAEKYAGAPGITGKRSTKAFFALMLCLQTCMVGVFAATDVFFFYVFFEVMLVPMYFLIGSYGGPKRQYAAVKFFLYSLFGGLLMLAAVIGVYVVSANLLNGRGTFDFSTLANLNIDPGMQKALFLGFFIAFAIKAPLFPFHTWLPDAGGQAPAGAAVLLVGVLDKVGTFGFLRYCIPLFPDASQFFAPYVFALALIGIFYGAFLAIGQSDLKRLVSYTSVAHFGFIALGCFAFTSQAGVGAVLYMVNHGLSTGALFLVVGFLAVRRQSVRVEDFGGTHKLVPLISGAFFIAGLSALALPGTNSFVSEFLVLIGTFTVNTTVAVIATLGMILAALYVLWMYQRTMHGPLNAAQPKMVDLSTREKWVIAPLIALIIFTGVYPKPIIDVITPAVKYTMQDIGKHDPQPSALSGGGK
ncbi:NADH-quinone oxidoreductase subunit M [Fodinicola acaciae]|uniref:NADH-quinone oxidoreductase subunit M n=1 Tax=Fodinicola acaciae TaxID=2681555 RepID=UPI0013D4A8E5|nr:NADH-quinone oxidoreductase subunit M [Fodinicola acaciae]